MFTHSVKWKSVEVREREERVSLNYARRKICPKSFAWTTDLKLSEHKKEMKELNQQREDNINALEQAAEEARAAHDLPPPSPIREAMEAQETGASKFTTNHGAVLGEPTVFVPSYQNRVQPLAQWPSKSEFKYEGDDRISTDRLHGRCLPTPRVPGNETVNWQHRAFLEPLPFDDFHLKYDDFDIFLRTHFISDMEISDEEGKGILGAEMMELLNPVDSL